MKIFLVLVLSPFFVFAESIPQTLVLRGKDLLSYKKLIRSDELYKNAWSKLKGRADKTLGKELYTVMSKSIIPDSGDKHDYMSYGPYWWPNPNKKDGLPFIRKDGVKNPAAFDERSDKPKLSRLISELNILSITYYLSEDEKYAERASKLIKTWFLDPKTKMNPNLNYGQAIPGRTKGRGIGIIETRLLGAVVDALILLEKSNHFKDGTVKQTKKWLDSYLTWLLESKNGIDELKTKNNHGTWYDVQVAVLALYCDRKEEELKVFKRVIDKRIPSQIKEDGSQPHELSRTRSLSYSMMNLQGFLHLARLAEHVKIDLWSVHDKRILKAALFLEKYSQEKWPYKQISKFEAYDLYGVMKLASAYKNPKLEAAVARMKNKAVNDLFFY